MADFSQLLDLTRMDYSKMRALNGRATDEAIELFVRKLNSFFSQFEKSAPTKNDITNYEKIMTQVTNKINKVKKIN
ncbi:hypothetical protein [Piscirickettsia litoralis]|uniref:Uncharacterized protein n=1 Tax=Piscirickettsia litoralis TaxID=1891921 RepID=A0ABX3A217_9GAMM|nr:hypothetical protein [Piscirickettsia litoralis]ODN41706.1 hypothetical protein BGC07_00295 [Piscirickettsia litoralis]